ncbi:MAG: FHA domain-containing protein [Anaerolineae bacterium]|nr:FHA domain-containing protein [Anaerolineae bacterium]
MVKLVNLPRYILGVATFIFVLILIMGDISQAAAQSAGKVIVSSLSFEAFPKVTFLLEAYNDQGVFISDLRTEEVQVLEDGYAVALDELTRIQPGLQVTIAINNAPALNTRLGDFTLFDYIQQTLIAWAQMPASNSPDDFSLSANSGLVVVHEKDRAKWLQALVSYPAEFSATDTSLVSLTQALDLATDPLPSPNMKRAILYVTPLVSVESLSALPNLADRAEELGIRVFIWVVDTNGRATPESLQAYGEFVQRTGGEMLVFTGSEALPNPDIYFEPLRYVYKASYTSSVNRSGEHQLVISVSRPDLQMNSEPQPFKLTVSPPNPIFLDPPTRIVRSWLLSESKKSKDAILTPAEVPISLMIEFPDSYQRQIKSVRLYVDGKLVAENMSEPFDKISWPLDLYQSSSTHLLRVEVEDILGLKQSSIETAVEVVVEPFRRSLWDQIFSGDRLLILLALIVAALILLTALFLTGRWTFIAQIKRRSRLKKDPLTQPVAVQKDTPRTRLSAAAHTPTVPRSLSGLSAPARLVRLSDSGHPIPSSVIPLNYKVCTFGSDPQQATIVLDSPSVDALHTRLTQVSEGVFVVADANSVAGTWVNYTPISDSGVVLQHGDMIHIGRVAFRFEMSIAPEMQQPKVADT